MEFRIIGYRFHFLRGKKDEHGVLPGRGFREREKVGSKIGPLSEILYKNFHTNVFRK